MMTSQATRIMRAVLFAVLVCVTLCAFGCAKDTILEFANAVMTNLGDNVLTKSQDLKGYRTFGTDTYTGTYSATYKGDTVSETLFGNTSILRKDGTSVRLSGHMAAEQGDARIVLAQGADEPRVLVDGDGTFDVELDIVPGSQYIRFESDGFTGELDLEIA